MPANDFLIQEAEAVDLGGLVVRVLPLQALIQVKAAMGRPKDKLVEAELRAIADVKKGRTRT
jgi:predicted nucleotidyltransferase